MNSGIYTAYSGMKARSEELDIAANNLANINTTGFKADRAFGSLLRDTLSDSGAPEGLGLAVNREVRTDKAIDFSDGVALPTGRELDVAVRDGGFLTVSTPRGVRYTRDGNLYQDSGGVLRTADGNPVLGASGGPITLAQGRVHISDEGGVYLDGEEVDRLKVVEFPDLSQVEKEGESLFVNNGEAEPKSKTGMVVRVGYLERSNVNAVRSVVEMVGILRHFEAIQKSLNYEANDMDAKVIEKLGS
ncbi:MAG: flagellar basal-body rod protein FlgF [Acidobacteriota bacterium]|nr:flagellar basal-body rod protein FlgF [Acidobacteriota bacterium]